MTRPLISADAHIGLPFAVIDELPAATRSQLPHIERRPEGNELVSEVYHGGARMEMTPTMAAAPGDQAIPLGELTEEQEAKLVLRNVTPNAAPSLLPEGRLADMARDGVAATVLILGSASFLPHLDDDGEIAYCQAANDWLADAYRHHLDRFAPGVSLPVHSVEASVRELERAASLGLRPAVLPDAIPERPYFNSEWDPLWELASDLGMPVALHVTDARPNAWRQISTGIPRISSESWFGASETGFVVSSAMMTETVAWFALGVLPRFPKLQVVMTEGNAGWLAWLADFLDYATLEGYQDLLATRGTGTRLKGNLVERPSHYIKTQIKATFMWDPVAIRNRDLTGTDCLMWGNDYPHCEGSFGNSQAWVAEQFAGVPDEEIDAIVRGNTAKLYGFDPLIEPLVVPA
jgi:predicted TIM-barrel fold metal-dependent hydrolase